MKNQLLRFTAVLLAVSPALGAATPADDLARYQPKPYIQVKHPEWVKDATIYELNLRQFSAEGTLRAAEAQLPRIRALGIDIIWLMPIHPIGEKNRKGPLGSPYAVKDYLAVNPEFGTLDDFKHFVATAHKLGLKVIIDWVANHTAWDNPLVERHPDWYQRDWDGDFRPTPWFDWTDIINLDYRSPAMRKYMTEALKFWVRETDIDGYRCDTAGLIPLDFWENARAELDAIKPVFMLGEWDSRDLHAKAFDASYAWGWYDALHRVCLGKADVSALFGYYSWHEGFYGHGTIRMTFVSNHDKNTWEGTEFEQFGDGLHAAIVLSVVGDGFPLIYNGQEAGYNKRLEFFVKDPIQWRDHPMADFYRQLFALRKAHPSLWNGPWGGLMVQVVNSAPTKVLSFAREKDGDKILALFNFSAEPQTVTLTDGPYVGAYTEYLTGEKIEFAAGAQLTLPAWGYKVYLK